MNKQETLEAVLDLFHWQKNRTECFNDMLFDLFQKADLTNKIRLATGFPTHFIVWQEWYQSKSSNEFFAKYLINKTYENNDV